MKWKKEEIEYLKNEYSKINGKNTTNITKRLAKELNRTEGAIRNKAYMLKITHKEKYYTKNEIQFLKENYDRLSLNDLAVKLNRNESNIFRKMK